MGERLHCAPGVLANGWGWGVHCAPGILASGGWRRGCTVHPVFWPVWGLGGGVTLCTRYFGQLGGGGGVHCAPGILANLGGGVRWGLHKEFCAQGILASWGGGGGALCTRCFDQLGEGGVALCTTYFDQTGAGWGCPLYSRYFDQTGGGWGCPLCTSYFDQTGGCTKHQVFWPNWGVGLHCALGILTNLEGGWGTVHQIFWPVGGQEGGELCTSYFDLLGQGGGGCKCSEHLSQHVHVHTLQIITCTYSHPTNHHHHQDDYSSCVG